MIWEGFTAFLLCITVVNYHFPSLKLDYLTLLGLFPFLPESIANLSSQPYSDCQQNQKLFVSKSVGKLLQIVLMLMLALTSCLYCTSTVALNALLCIFHHCMAV